MSTHDKDSNWGGARKGSGRKPIKNGKLVRRNIALTERHIDWLNENTENASQYIRDVLDLVIAAGGIDALRDGGGAG